MAASIIWITWSWHPGIMFGWKKFPLFGSHIKRMDFLLKINIVNNTQTFITTYYNIVNKFETNTTITLQTTESINFQQFFKTIFNIFIAVYKVLKQIISLRHYSKAVSKIC